MAPSHRQGRDQTPAARFWTDTTYVWGHTYHFGMERVSVGVLPQKKAIFYAQEHT